MRLPLWLAACATSGPATSAPPPDGERVYERVTLATTARAKGVRDEAVLAALAATPRHRFVPEAFAADAYADRPLPIGDGQTISQPSLVAMMTEMVHPAPTDRVLEVGCGSGYQAAILARLAAHVYTVEIICPLADAARARLAALGHDNVTVRCADGWAGWPEQAPFDVIVVTAAPEHIPPALLAQLAPGGRMIVPVGPQLAAQTLTLVERDAEGAYKTTAGIAVLFVPMTGGDEAPP